MADVDTYQRVTLKFETPYARRGGARQVWQLKFSLSGDTALDAAGAASLAGDLAAPVLLLASPDTSYTGFLYYLAGSNINSHQASYAYGANPGSGNGYVAGGSPTTVQLEVIALARAVTGVSSNGKPVYLMKHIHDIYQPVDSPGELAPPLADVLDAWSTGCGPNDQVTVSPTTGELSQPWTIDSALYTRQLRRGYIPKA